MDRRDPHPVRRWIASYGISIVLHILALFVFLVLSVDFIDERQTDDAALGPIGVTTETFPIAPDDRVTSAAPLTPRAVAPRSPAVAQPVPTAVPPATVGAPAPTIAPPVPAALVASKPAAQPRPPAPRRPVTSVAPRAELARNVANAPPQAASTPESAPAASPPSQVPATPAPPEPQRATVVMRLVIPTAEPTVAPSMPPTVAPAPAAAVVPTRAPTTAPTLVPTAAPTLAPTVTPTVAPTAAPTRPPTAAPTLAPTVAPTVAPTAAPTVAPTVAPTRAPTAAPTRPPTATPTLEPTVGPTIPPTAAPAAVPTVPAASPRPTSEASPLRRPAAAPTVPPTGHAAPAAAARAQQAPVSGSSRSAVGTRVARSGSAGRNPGARATAAAAGVALVPPSRAVTGATATDALASLNDRLKRLNTGGPVDYSEKRVAIGDAQSIYDEAMSAYAARFAPPPDILRRTFGFIYRRRTASAPDSVVYVYDTYALGPITVCKAWEIVEHPYHEVPVVGSVAGSAGIGGATVSNANSPVVRHDNGGAGEARTIIFPCSPKSYTAVPPGSITTPLPLHPPTAAPAALGTPAPAASLAP
jgi:hypothetical protein